MTGQYRVTVDGPWPIEGDGTECVAVELSNEQCEYVSEASFGAPSETVATSYTADWVAEVQHRWEQRAYGFPKCIKCKLQNY